ncbi:hypothetical protein BDP81DRAFT_440485 [Colletotrichum phormii]|uniref:Uncharacterized protein n=1 Tax=Colletotrichum phormii TaxID=359342 RepID=A0AAJ0E8J2_9PEZI|nr:uncharacterized protein BDP81DRAFT_440485 [Colletotrichum phormii]KAK1622919.1 hypothetical protein BDP81DRAFT_440485 [Colletotrichum phormii]
MVIMRWSKDKLNDMRGKHYDPFFGKPIDDQLDDWVACANDRNYLFLRWPTKDTSMAADMGQTQETLKSFDLIHQIVIDASEAMQGRTLKWMARSFSDLTDFLKDLATRPPKSSDQLIQMNMPVCNLDIFDTIEIDYNDCVIIIGCIQGVLRKNCPKLILNGAAFPYVDYN